MEQGERSRKGKHLTREERIVTIETRVAVQSTHTSA
jgi:hypothetical protein